MSLAMKYWPEETCSNPVRSLSFAKTHKTGGSTLQNIFLRYGWKHNLTFVLPAKRTWMFTYKSAFNVKLAKSYPSWNKENVFQLFTFHSIWNHQQVHQLVPEGPSITILRDPVDLFSSGYVYMGLDKFYGLNINQLAANPKFLKRQS